MLSSLLSTASSHFSLYERQYFTVYDVSLNFMGILLSSYKPENVPLVPANLNVCTSENYFFAVIVITFYLFKAADNKVSS